MALWLTGHVIVFAILGSVLVLKVEANFRDAGLLTKDRAYLKIPAEFGVRWRSRGSSPGWLQVRPVCQRMVPAPCFDEEKHAYFVNQHDYYFWADKDKRQRIPQEKLLEGTLEYPELFVNFEEHFEHCRYLLSATKRYAHSPNLGVLDVHMDEEHMNHCIDFLRESRDPYTVEAGVKAYFGYRKCFLPRLDIA